MSFDDELRRRMQDAADRAGAGADPAAITHQVATKAATGPKPALRLLGALGAGGLVLGGVLGFTALRPGTTQASRPATVDVQQFALYDCPDGAPLGHVYPGDRVFVVGRDGSGGWLAVRDPRDIALTRWLPTRAVRPDGATADVPALTCQQTVVMNAGTADTVPATTTSSTAVPTTASTTLADSTTTVAVTVPPTVPPTVPATTTRPTAPPTTKPASTTTTNQPPVIGVLTASPNDIRIDLCGAAGASSTVKVPVADATGVASVRVDWTLPTSTTGQSTGSVTLKPVGGGVYSGSITVTNNPPYAGAFMNLTITATDQLGLTSVRNANSTLHVTYCLG